MSNNKFDLGKEVYKRANGVYPGESAAAQEGDKATSQGENLDADPVSAADPTPRTEDIHDQCHGKSDDEAFEIMQAHARRLEREAAELKRQLNDEHRIDLLIGEKDISDKEWLRRNKVAMQARNEEIEQAESKRTADIKRCWQLCKEESQNARDHHNAALDPTAMAIHASGGMAADRAANAIAAEFPDIKFTEG